MIENIMTQSPFGSVAIHASIPLLEISKLFLSDLTYAVSSEVNLERAAGRKKNLICNNVLRSLHERIPYCPARGNKSA